MTALTGRLPTGGGLRPDLGRSVAARLPAFIWHTLDEVGQRARRHPDGLVDLSKGSPVDPVPAVVQRALAAASADPGYPTTAGTAALREAAAGWLARCHGVTAEPGQILPTIGSKELLGLLPLLLGLGPADAVVRPTLAYPSYEIGAQLVGAEVVADDDVSGRDPVLPSGRQIRLVWLNSPANPTGRVLPADHVRRVVEWARACGAVVASDECYLDLGWSARPVSVLAPAVAGGSFANLLAVHSLSKRSNLAGYRAGLVTGDTEVIGALLAARRQMGLMSPTPVQGAMVAALADDAHVEVNRRRHAARRQSLWSAFEAAGWTIDHSEAGLFLWARHADLDGWAAAEWLAERGILVAPGDLYGPTGHRHIRVAITATDRDVAAVAARLSPDAR